MRMRYNGGHKELNILHILTVILVALVAIEHIGIMGIELLGSSAFLAKTLNSLSGSSTPSFTNGVSQSRSL